jgi:O-antigen/teichoic acid export membrane protein
MADGLVEVAAPPRPLVQIGQTFAAKVVIAVGRVALLGVFARALDPADLGAYSLTTTAVAFGIILLGLNANQYTYRSVPGRPLAEGLRIASSVALFEVGLAVGLVGAFLFSGAFDLALRILHVEPYRVAFVLALLWILAEIVDQNLLVYLYARQRIGEASLLDLIKQVGWVPVVAAAWFVTGQLSVDLVVGAGLAGSLAGAIFGLARVRPTIAPSRGAIRSAVAFGVPLIGPAVAFQALKLADRFVLSATRNLEETGVYALAASFTNLLYSFSALVIANTLTPIAIRAQNEGDVTRRDKVLWRTMGYSLTAYLAGAIALWLIGISVLARFARPEYGAAIPFFPWLAVGYALIVVSAAPQNALYLANRTRAILIIDLIATAIAIGLDLVLIPRYGGYGAAAATVVGFGGGAAAKFVASGLWRSFSRESLLPGPAEIAQRIRALRAP